LWGGVKREKKAKKGKGNSDCWGVGEDRCNHKG